MKSKEEPSLGSTRGNLSSLEETTGSLSRPGRTAAAPSEKPALSPLPRVSVWRTPGCKSKDYSA